MKKIAGLIIVMGLVAAACGGGQQKAAPVEAPAVENASQPGTPVQPGANPATPGTAVEGEPAPTGTSAALLRGPGAIDLTEPASGLESLPNYQAVLKLAFSGQKDGQPYQSARTYTLTVQREPAARLLVEEATAPDGTATRRVFADLAGVVYRQETVDGPCQASLADGGGNQSRFEPASLLPHLLGAELAGEETADGIATQVLKFDAQALGAQALGMAGEAEGTARIASQGGYLVGYSLRLQAGEEVFGAGLQGEQTWEYTLSQPGAEAFKLPQACPQGGLDLAALPDAENILRLPGYLRYTTSQEASSVSAFYTEQLALAGWQASGDPNETVGGSRQLYLRLVGEQEQAALLTTRPLAAGLEVTLAVLP